MASLRGCRWRAARFRRAGPGDDTEFGAAESEGMSAVCIELHFDGDARVLERDVVDERVVDVVEWSSSACSRKVGGVWRVM